MASGADTANESENGAQQEKHKEKATIYPLPVMLARKLWGEPTSRQRDEYHFGTGNNLKMVNARDGSSVDFENNVSGYRRT